MRRPYGQPNGEAGTIRKGSDVFDIEEAPLTQDDLDQWQRQGPIGKLHLNETQSCDKLEDVHALGKRVQIQAGAYRRP